MIEDSGDPFATERGVDLDPEALPGVVIDHREHTHLLPTGGAVVNEVQAPALVAFLWCLRLGPSVDTLFAPLVLGHLQPCLLVNPEVPLMVVVHAFTLQVHFQPPVSPASAFLGFGHQLPLQGRIVPGASLIGIATFIELDQPAGPLHAHFIGGPQVAHGVAFLCRLYQFFEFFGG